MRAAGSRDVPTVSPDTVLSSAWCAQAEAQLTGLDTGVGSVIAQFLAVGPRGSRCSFQEFRDGVLTRWAWGEHPAPDVVVGFPSEAAARFVSGRAVPSDLASGWLATVADTRHPLPPFDEAVAPSPGAADRVSDATLTVAVSACDSPVGDVAYTLRFEEGIQVEHSLGPVESADVRVPLSFEGLLRHRLGEWSLAEALAGEPQGAWPELMLTAGLIEAPARLQAVRERMAPGEVLRAFLLLSEIMTSPNYRNALAELVVAG